MVWHPLAALTKVPGLTEVVLIGFYEDSVMAGFIKDSKREFPDITISYLREYRPLGTAGGLYHCKLCPTDGEAVADVQSETPFYVRLHLSISLSATLMYAVRSL